MIVVFKEDLLEAIDLTKELVKRLDDLYKSLEKIFQAVDEIGSFLEFYDKFEKQIEELTGEKPTENIYATSIKEFRKGLVKLLKKLISETTDNEFKVKHADFLKKFDDVE